MASLLLCGAAFSGCSDDDDASISGQMPPKLISIIPKAASSGETAIISGVYFSENIAENEVTVNGVKAEVTAAATNRLVVTLPDNPDGTYPVKVTVRGQSVEGLKITYAPGRKIELAVLQCMPSMAYVGDEIKIIGQCFSSVASENKVTINGAEAVVKEASANMLTIVVPDTQEGTYPVSVTVGGKTATGSSFTYGHIVRLTALTLTPETGHAGDAVVIEGEGFGATPADNLVTVNGKKAEVTEVTKTSLTVVMPENPAGTYPVVITVGESTVDNKSFTYINDDVLTVTTIAGSGTADVVEGIGKAAAIRSPQGIAMAADGSLWICLQNSKGLMRMAPDFSVKKVEVTGADLNAPWGCAFDKEGKLVVANKANHTVIRVAADGSATPVLTADDWKGPMGVAVGSDGALYVADRDAKAIRKIGTDGKLAQSFDMSDCKQGPCGVAVDQRGNVYAINGGDYTMYMFKPDGTRSVLMGDGVKPTADTWSDGEPGNPLSATTGQSFALHIDSDGIMYITDLMAFVVRTLTPDASGDYTKGTVSTIAGVPFVKGKADGVADAATFNQLGGIVSHDGKIYVADNANHMIRLISKK